MVGASQVENGELIGRMTLAKMAEKREESDKLTEADPINNPPIEYFHKPMTVRGEVKWGKTVDVYVRRKAV